MIDMTLLNNLCLSKLMMIDMTLLNNLYLSKLTNNYNHLLKKQ